MEKSLWLAVFVASLAGLSLIAVRRRFGFGWLRVAAMNVVTGGVLLYALGLAEPYTHLHLPLNAATVGTVGVLGVPGLAALIGLKLLVLGS